MNGNRLNHGNPAGRVDAKLQDMFAYDEKSLQRTFHLGQVISSDDKNANRLRVRIPLLDDVFYLDENGVLKDSIGDEKLPWCIPSNSRLIETPENGSVVLVGLFDSQKPYTGRVWITAVTEKNSKDIFDVDRLTEELTSDVWNNAEETVNVHYNSSPEVNGRAKIKSKNKTTNYKTGIRGKDKNKLLFDEKQTLLTQNEGTTKESKLKLTENVLLMGKQLEILSSQSSNKESPVFADPLFKFMKQHLDLTKSMIQYIATTPGIIGTPVAGSPVLPSPTVGTLSAAYIQLLLQFNQLKINGKSSYLKIN